MSQPGSKTLTLTNDELVVIDRALQQMPFGQVAALYNKINTQIAAQQEVDDADQSRGSGNENSS